MDYEIQQEKIEENYEVGVQEVVDRLGFTRTRLSQLTSSGVFSFQRRKVGLRQRIFYRRSEIDAYCAKYGTRIFPGSLHQNSPVPEESGKGALSYPESTFQELGAVPLPELIGDAPVEERRIFMGGQNRNLQRRTLPEATLYYGQKKQEVALQQRLKELLEGVQNLSHRMEERVEALDTLLCDLPRKIQDQQRRDQMMFTFQLRRDIENLMKHDKFLCYSPPREELPSKAKPRKRRSLIPKASARPPLAGKKSRVCPQDSLKR